MAVWEQRAEEPDEWYARFRAYLLLGPERTVTAAHIFALHLAEESRLGNVRGWQREARRFEWRERALAFDAEQSHREFGGDERLRMVAELLHQVYGALRQADIPALSKEEVRSLLPTFRLFFHDLLKFHQSATAQLLAGKGIGQDGEGALAISADDFNAIMKDSRTAAELRDLAAQAAQAAVQSPGAVGGWTAESSWLPLRDLLCRLYADEAGARRIAAQAQLDVARIHFGGSALDRWQAILTEAVHAVAMRRVIEAVRNEYGDNDELAGAVRAYEAWRAWGAIEKRRR